MQTLSEKNNDIIQAIGIEIGNLQNRLDNIKNLLGLTKKEMTVDEFQKLDASAMLKWKADNPEAYKQMVSNQ